MSFSPSSGPSDGNQHHAPWAAFPPTISISQLNNDTVHPCTRIACERGKSQTKRAMVTSYRYVLTRTPNTWSMDELWKTYPLWRRNRNGDFVVLIWDWYSLLRSSSWCMYRDGCNVCLQFIVMTETIEVKPEQMDDFATGAEKGFDLLASCRFVPLCGGEQTKRDKQRWNIDTMNRWQKDESTSSFVEFGIQKSSTWTFLKRS